MDNQKIRDVFSDEQFVVALLELDTAEEVQSTLKEKGLEFTLDEIDQIKNQLTSSSADTLSEADLDNVAGGSAIATTCAVISCAIAVDGYMHRKRRRW